MKWLTLEAPFFGWINEQRYLLDSVREEKPGKLTFSEGSWRLPADRDVLDLRLHGARVRMGALPRPRMRLHKPGSPFAPPFRAVGLILEPASTK